MTLRITTWNINSLRLRIEHLARLAAVLRPDLLCLQETKVRDEFFPRRDLQALGFPHQHFYGMKGYNGVAILSRLPFDSLEKHDWCGRADSRHISLRLGGKRGKGLELHNLYVPAGGDVPDPGANDKFAHKLAFLKEVTAWFTKSRAAKRPLILVGDFNVAPLETDVWSHKQLLKVVSHTPVEVALLGKLLKSLNGVDAVRHFIPPEERLYTWWSYRARDWRAANRGRRLDHVWVTQPLGARLKKAHVLVEARDWDKPSDHVPVTVDFTL